MKNVFLSARPNGGAGAAHQFCNWNVAYTFSRKYGLKFVHQPFAIWEDFLRFGIGEIQYAGLGANHIQMPMLDLDSSDGIRKLGEFVAEAEDGDLLEFSYNQNMGDHTYTMDLVSEKYWGQHTPSTCYRNGSIKVGVHIRRGDLANLPEDEMLSRFLPSAYYKKQIDAIRDRYSNLDIHVFSEGDKSQFEELRDFTLHLSESHFDSLNDLASADIIISSRSGFSYFAGIISKGMKIFPCPWWHFVPDEGKWIHSDLSGNFNIERLRECLG